MADVPDEGLPQRDPGAQRPERAADFPRPWPLPRRDVPGWFCPTSEWPPEQELDSGWPGNDPDTASGEKRNEKDAE